MKISVSLSDEDAAFVDVYLAEYRRASRSAVLKEAIDLLRQQGLQNQYAAAFTEFTDFGDAALWDATTNDGRTA